MVARHGRCMCQLPYRNAINWYRTDMAIIAFAITLGAFFVAQYLQFSSTSAPRFQGLFIKNGAHHRHQAHLGGVASESSVCSQIGIDLLKMGGNAADAVSGYRAQN